MGFKDIFRKRTTKSPPVNGIDGDHIQSMVAATFQAVLSGAKGLEVYTGIDRDDPRFDENMGAILADRIEDGSKPDMSCLSLIHI